MTALPHEGDAGSHTVEFVEHDDGWHVECDECGWGKGPYPSEEAAEVSISAHA